MRKQVADHRHRQLAPCAASRRARCRLQDAGPESLNDHANQHRQSKPVENPGQRAGVKDPLGQHRGGDRWSRRGERSQCSTLLLSGRLTQMRATASGKRRIAAYHRIASNVDLVSNMIAFNALKTERSTFGAISR